MSILTSHIRCPVRDPRDRPLAPRAVGGFTLIEVMGALVVFSVGVLMVMSLSGALSVQMSRAAQRSKLTFEVQNQMDSLQAQPYDSLLVGATRDTIVLMGKAFIRTRGITQVNFVTRELLVSVEPASGPGPRLAASSFVSRPW